MCRQPVMALVVEAFDGGFFDGPVHPLDLTVGSRMVRFGEPVFDVVCLADHVEADLTRPGGVSFGRLLSELHAIIGQDRVDVERCGFQPVVEKSHAVRLLALSTSCVTANLLVRSIPTNRYILPSAVCATAISM